MIFELLQIPDINLSVGKIHAYTRVHNAFARAAHLYSALVSRTFSRRDDCTTSTRRVLFVTREIRP